MTKRNYGLLVLAEVPAGFARSLQIQEACPGGDIQIMMILDAGSNGVQNGSFISVPRHSVGELGGALARVAAKNDGKVR